MKQKLLIALSAIIGLLILFPLTGLAGDMSVGSGFYISTDGYFVTNYHVISGSNSITIRDVNGNLFPAEVVKVDKNNDLAILKAKGKFQALAIENSSYVKRGAAVVAIGFPHVNVQGLEPKVTDGLINSLAGAQDDPRYFQISAAVQSGNSGGPLMNMQGNVICIVTAKLGAAEVLKETGDLTQNVNYAIKSNPLLALAQTMKFRIKLIPVNKKKKADVAEIYALAESAIGLVVAESNKLKTPAAEAAVVKQESPEKPVESIAPTPKKTEPTPPQNYVTQGGLTWAPITTFANWDEAKAICANSSSQGFSDWRMPTFSELSALYASGALTTVPVGWTLRQTWASKGEGPMGYNLQYGTVNMSNMPDTTYVSCVREQS